MSTREAKVDENEKDLVSKIFKTCRALERISGSYFRGEIHETIFLNLFAVDHKKLNDYFDEFLRR